MNKGENPIIVLLIVAVLAIYGFYLMKNNPVSTLPTQENVQPTNPRYQNVNPINTYNPQTLSFYEQALSEYKDARIQLDDKCQATPNYVTYKNNTSVMIDNRSASSRIIKLGSTYNIEPYGFKIIFLSSPITPLAWYLSCNESKNVATILVQ